MHPTLTTSTASIFAILSAGNGEDVSVDYFEGSCPQGEAQESLVLDEISESLEQMSAADWRALGFDLQGQQRRIKAHVTLTYRDLQTDDDVSLQFANLSEHRN